MKKLFTAMLSLLILCSCAAAGGAKGPKKGKSYEEYIQYFEEVYDTMNKNYYLEVPREKFDAFVKDFDEKIFANLKSTGKSENYIRWRSASFLVGRLKSEEDVFSELYPPEPAKEYKQEALGQKIDLGITGERRDIGYAVTHIEPRSDAYEKGLRQGDIITEFNGAPVTALSDEVLTDHLNPLAGSTVRLSYLSHETKAQHSIQVTSKEYFKQTVYLKPLSVPDIYLLELQKFNRKTGDDMLLFMSYIMKRNPKGLIIDIRGNPGGPPLAAREISSFFLPGGEDFAYFQKKNRIPAQLDVPMIRPEFKYDGPLVILTDEGSGSASELFSGVMQRKGRAVLLGRNTAGKVMLKSMFNLSDGAMVLLVTSRGHFPDGTPFSFKGVTPNHYVEPEKEDILINMAVNYLLQVNSGEIDQ